MILFVAVLISLLCFSHVRAQPETDPFQLDKTGVPCRKDVECGPGFYCQHVFLFQKVCKPLMAIGASCSKDRECVSKQCDKKKKACVGGSSKYNETCVQSSDCEPNLYCTSILKGVSSEVKNITDFRCVHKMKEGQICLVPDECENNLFCAQGICSSTDMFLERDMDWVDLVIISAGSFVLFLALFFVVYFSNAVSYFFPGPSTWFYRDQAIPFSAFSSYKTKWDRKRN